MPVTAVRRCSATLWRRALPLAAALLLGACAARLPAVTDGPAPEGSASRLPFDDAALSADGRLLVRRAAGGITRVDVAPSEARDAPPPDRGALALAPAGTLAAVVSEARPAELVVLETSSGREVARIEASGGEAVVTFAFSRDGRSLVIATASGVERRSVSDGRRLAAWAVPDVLALTPFPSADDAIVITGERRRRPFVALLLDRRRRPRRLPIAGIFAPQRIAVSADGRWLAIASYDAAAPRPRPLLSRRDAYAAHARPLAIWDLQTMTPTSAAPPLKRFDGASALTFAADDRLVASVGSPCNGEHERLIVWSLTRSELLLDRPLSRLDDLRVIDGALLGADDETLLRIDAHTGEVTTLQSCGDAGSCRVVLCG